MSHCTKRIKFTDDSIRIMTELYEAGSSFFDISKKYGCAKNTVRKYLLLNGIETNRNRSISVKNKGKTSPRKGAKWTQETRLLFMESSKKRKSWGGHIGVYDENRSQKMRDAFNNDRPNRLAILRRSASIAWAKRRIPEEERLLRSKQRTKYKNMFRRFIRATGKKKCSKTESALGYSRIEFIEHIEKQFKPGMSWTIRESFHVDHIVPVSEFIRRGIDDPRIICALDNLQPLYPQENRIKSDKLLEPIP